MRRTAALAVWVMLVSTAVFAGDWPQWRGPSRDGVAPDSPPLVEQLDKDGPKKVWESEPIPGDEQGGFAQPVVAEGKVFVFHNHRYDDPIAQRVLTKDGLTSLGWTAGMPDDLAKAMEEARTGEDRVKVSNNYDALTKWRDEWVKANVKPDARQFQPAVKARLMQGTQAVPLDSLRKLEKITGTEFATQAELDAWMKEQGVNEADVKGIMRAVPTTVRACKDVVFCLDRTTGNTVWKKEVPGQWMYYECSHTPAVSGGRCYFLGSNAVAYCLNAADGTQVWESKQFGAPGHSHNRSSSVLLTDGKVIFGTDTGLYALDANTGELTWTGKDEKGGRVANKEASAVPWSSGGKSYVLFAGDQKVHCIDLETGKGLWTIPAPGGYTACTPAVSGDTMAFCSGAPEVGLTAYRISLEEPKKLWSVPFKDGYTCPIIYRDHVYAVGGGSDFFGGKKQGRALCVEIATGKVAWDETIGAGAEFSTPLLADGKVIAEVGPWLYLIKASPEKYELVGKADLGLAKWTTPAFADGMAYVRTGQKVVCYDLRKQ